MDCMGISCVDLRGIKCNITIYIRHFLISSKSSYLVSAFHRLIAMI